MMYSLYKQFLPVVLGITGDRVKILPAFANFLVLEKEDAVSASS